MANKRESSGVTARATPRRRSGGERPTAPTATARPGAGPRLATGDLPLAELGGGALVGAVAGRLIGGGLRGTALGAAVGAAAGTALGLMTGALLGGGSARTERDPREPAFGPRVDPEKRTAPLSPAGPPRAAEERGDSDTAESIAAPAVESASEAAPVESASQAATVRPAEEETEPRGESPEEPALEAQGLPESAVGSEEDEEEAAARSGEASPKAPDYASWTKAELYEEAKRLQITGRSAMTKAELVAALRRATFHT